MMAVAVAATCPSSYLDNEWNLPDRKMLCEDLGYSDCNIMLEKLLLDRHADEAYRIDEESLGFRVGRTEEFVLRNQTQDRHRYEAYRYWGTLGDYHLIRVQFSEAVWFGLLNRVSGRFTKIGGIPHISPNGRWMASRRLTVHGARRQMIDIWKVDGDGYVRHTAEYFAIERAYPDNVGRPLLTWLSDDTLQVCWAYSSGRKEIVTIGYFRFDGAKWTAGPVSAKE